MSINVHRGAHGTPGSTLAGTADRWVVDEEQRVVAGRNAGAGAATALVVRAVSASPFVSSAGCGRIMGGGFCAGVRIGDMGALPHAMIGRWRRSGICCPPSSSCWPSPSESRSCCGEGGVCVGAMAREGVAGGVSGYGTGRARRRCWRWRRCVAWTRCCWRRRPSPSSSWSSSTRPHDVMTTAARWDRTAVDGPEG